MKIHSSSTKKFAEPPVHFETASSADSNSSSGLDPLGLSEYDVGSGGIYRFSPGAGADLSSKWAPLWNVPHSGHLTDPLGCMDAHTGQDVAPINLLRGSDILFNKHIFLITYDLFSIIGLNDNRFFFVIKLDNRAIEFLTFDH